MFSPAFRKLAGSLVLVVVLGMSSLLTGCVKNEPPPSEELQKPTGMKSDPSQMPPGGNIRDPANQTPQGVMPLRGKKR